MATTKLCRRCKREPKIAGSSYCTLCRREYDSRYFKANVVVKSASAATLKRELLKWYNGLKHGKICMQCGGGPFHACQLDYDHMPGHHKVLEVSKMVRLGYSKEKVMQEISKCQLICASCHRLRTFYRRIGKEIPQGLF